MQNCFKCGKGKLKDKCEHCGYEFSIPIKCPKLSNYGNSIQCFITKKLCNVRDYNTCKILREND